MAIIRILGVTMKLYGYWRSSAAYRARIGLNIKGIDYQQESVHLVKDGGQQHGDAYREINPAGLVPALEVGGTIIRQSMAILEYLEEKIPEPELLPGNLDQKAQIRALAYDLAMDAHPLNNLRVLQYLKGDMQQSEEAVNLWYHHWLDKAFAPLEHQAKHLKSSGRFIWHDQLTMADVLLIPQIYNALRFNLDMTPYPLLTSIYEHCNSLDAFIQAAPEKQPDAV